jgi:serine phosphatase RsbU (regulator of sigma subunit)/anti-anti-sigma regulatory factor
MVAERQQPFGGAMMEQPTPRDDSRPGILIVDDDEDIRALLARALADAEDREFELASSAAEARESLIRRPFDIVITDLSMPDEDGVSLMRWAAEHRPGALWIVFTGHGTLENAVEALQLGAFDFFSKPLHEFDSLRNAVRNALSHQRLLAESKRLEQELKESNERLRRNVEKLEEACGLLEEQAGALRDDLLQAGVIQRALLPRDAPGLDRHHVRAHYRPSQNVGGDLYDVTRLDERHVALLVADAAGHGLAAAMLAVLFRSQLPLIDGATGAPRDPREVMAMVSRSICEALSGSAHFVTAVYCLLDTETGRATIASAGHPPVFWLRPGRDLERIFHTGPALGLYPAADYAQQEIELDEGDHLFFYSDGLYDLLPKDGAAPDESIAAAFEASQRDPVLAFDGLFSAHSSSASPDDANRDDVTALMLVASPGESLLDNGAAPLLSPPASVPAPSASQALVGVDSGRTSLSIRGLGDWTRSFGFHSACAAAIHESQHVTVDLTLCEQLDSTFLGTVHALCQLADDADVEFRLQGVTPGIEALFEELGMRNVADHIVPCMLPLPTRMRPVDAHPSDRWAQAQHLLWAHEALVKLNARNRRQFDPLLAQLSREAALLAR